MRDSSRVSSLGSFSLVFRRPLSLSTSSFFISFDVIFRRFPRFCLSSLSYIVVYLLLFSTSFFVTFDVVVFRRFFVFFSLGIGSDDRMCRMRGCSRL